MISKAQIKHISGLRAKKYRTEHSQFIVEGQKSINELIRSQYTVNHIYYSPQLSENAEKLVFAQKTTISDIEMAKISLQKKPEGILAIAEIPKKEDFQWKSAQYIALDSIRDPGNMGTIIRLADWFGVHLICSLDCVELYNPKVIQSSMGSLFNTSIHYLNLAKALSETDLPIFSAMLEGESIYDYPTQASGVLLIGNEANGISPEIKELSTEKITIPGGENTESLNAAIACGILTSYLFR
jgi:TrmH family RNA methyltransferase